jgi:hypothetical protein
MSTDVGKSDFRDRVALGAEPLNEINTFSQGKVEFTFVVKKF